MHDRLRPIEGREQPDRAGEFTLQFRHQLANGTGDLHGVRARLSETAKTMMDAGGLKPRAKK